MKVYVIKKSIIILCFVFSSCVYFNTFYNAKESFKNAQKIINNDSSKNYQDNITISNAAKKLLNESISSSNRVLEKFPDSKYVDDAIYYIARSYFSLGEIYKSEKFFKMLIDQFPQSDFYDESRIWLQYSNFNLGKTDSILTFIDLIENDLNTNNTNENYLYYLLYNLRGDINMDAGQFSEAFNDYEKSLEFINDRSKKIMMYSKLSLKYESAKQYDTALQYLKKVQSLSNDNDIKVESFRKWLEIMKRNNSYEEIVVEIQEKLLMPEFETVNIQDELNLELAISYMRLNSYDESKNILNKIVETTNQKLLKAESYYWLGYISLFFEFKIDLSIEYFDKVSETMRSSKFTKKSRDFIKDIDSYKALVDEYNFLINEKETEITLENKNDENFYPNPNSQNTIVTKDSLLFIIAEKLFFDFKQYELSIKKHQDLIELYPYSKYSSRSNQIINNQEKKIDSTFFKVDSLTLKRDIAWNEFFNNEISLENSGLKKLKKITNDYDDFLTYYSLGFLYENYLFDSQNSIDNYLIAFQKCEDEKLKKELKNKLLMLEQDILNTLDNESKILNFNIAISFLTSGNNLDSALKYLDFKKISNKNESKIDVVSKNLNDLINFYIAKNNDYISNTSSINDSSLFNLAIISKVIFQNENLANDYFKNITDSSKYYMKLSNFLTNNIFDTISNKTIFYYDSLNKEILNFIVDTSLTIENIDNRKKLLVLFSDSLLNGNSLIDTLIKDENYQNNLPNINNRLTPNINKQ